MLLLCKSAQDVGLGVFGRVASSEEAYPVLCSWLQARARQQLLSLSLHKSCEELITVFGGSALWPWITRAERGCAAIAAIL